MEKRVRADREKRAMIPDRRKFFWGGDKLAGGRRRDLWPPRAPNEPRSWLLAVKAVSEHRRAQGERAAAHTERKGRPVSKAFAAISSQPPPENAGLPTSPCTTRALPERWRVGDANRYGWCPELRTPLRGFARLLGEALRDRVLFCRFRPNTESEAASRPSTHDNRRYVAMENAPGRSWFSADTDPRRSLGGSGYSEGDSRKPSRGSAEDAQVDSIEWSIRWFDLTENYAVLAALQAGDAVACAIRCHLSPGYSTTGRSGQRSPGAAGGQAASAVICCRSRFPALAHG